MEIKRELKYKNRTKKIKRTKRELKYKGLRLTLLNYKN